MDHYRDSQGGDFYLDRDRATRPSPDGELPLLRFLRRHGVAFELWSDTGARQDEVPWLLREAGLDWSVERREVLVPVCGDHVTPRPVRGYRALVRPDRDEVMSVVSSAYRIAENESVARAAVASARRFDDEARLVAAAGFGRTQERTLFVVRVRATDAATLVLLAHNTHGGDGAVRFQLVEVDRDLCAVLAPDSRHAALSLPHVGDMDERLDGLRFRSMVQDHVDEVQAARDRLNATLWTSRHTRSLIRELWGEPQSATPVRGGQRPQDPSERAPRHPGPHLASVLAGCVDPGEAYRLVCAYLDNDSEACERGDFTRDRDERLALGAGLRIKQRLWRWMIAHV